MEYICIYDELTTEEVVKRVIKSKNIDDLITHIKELKKYNCMNFKIYRAKEIKYEK